MATSNARTVAATVLVNVPTVPHAVAVAEQVLLRQATTPAVVAMAEQMMLVPSAPTAANVFAVTEQVMIKAIPITRARTVAGTVLATLPTNTQDYNVRLEVLGAGFIPNHINDTCMEVLAGIPFNAKDYGVTMEVLAASSTPVPLVTTRTHFWISS